MKRKLRLALAIPGILLVLASQALADGTETLGPPSVPVATGTDVLVAGLGMQALPNLPGSLSFTVPAGATVKQALLYWQGHHTAPVFSAGDNTITVDGTPVVGTLIGGPTVFFQQFVGPVDGLETFSAYRADITSRVTAGTNSLTISDMLFASNIPLSGPYTQGNDGVGIVVIYDDGSDSSVIGLRDGLDLAFHAFAPPLDTTALQTLTFAPSPLARSASLSTLAGSVSGSDPQLRGNVLRITYEGGGSEEIVNPWQSLDGDQFDALTSSITIPANASWLTIQALSAGGDLPASFAWLAASVTAENPPRTGGGEGCTPGYWKNHLGVWPAAYSPTQQLSTVFSPAGLGTLGSKTLLEALKFKGGSTLTAKKQNLLRIGVASLLNAAHADVSFGATVAEVIAAINDALGSNDTSVMAALQADLDEQNNAGCPLGRD